MARGEEEGGDTGRGCLSASSRSLKGWLFPLPARLEVKGTPGNTNILGLGQNVLLSSDGTRFCITATEDFLLQLVQVAGLVISPAYHRNKEQLHHDHSLGLTWCLHLQLGLQGAQDLPADTQQSFPTFCSKEPTRELGTLHPAQVRVLAWRMLTCNEVAQPRRGGWPLQPLSLPSQQFWLHCSPQVP